MLGGYAVECHFEDLRGSRACLAVSPPRLFIPAAISQARVPNR
jgi:hypothetical protein